VPYRRILLALGLAVSAAGCSSPHATPHVVTSTRPLAVDLHRGLSPALPALLSIPAISLRAPIIRLGLNADHTVQVPPFNQPQEVGWYQGGPAPGSPGAAVIIGHLDTYDSTAAFTHLRDLTQGDQIQVTRADGTIATFTVQSVHQYPKDHFPTASVYADPGYPALRLITCGGAFNFTTRHYLDSIVIYARLASADIPLTPVPHPRVIYHVPPKPSHHDVKTPGTPAPAAKAAGA
jgi:LPXTG-site transpeptidase (sortase) family protein